MLPTANISLYLLKDSRITRNQLLFLLKKKRKFICINQTESSFKYCKNTHSQNMKLFESKVVNDKTKRKKWSYYNSCNVRPYNERSAMFVQNLNQTF